MIWFFYEISVAGGLITDQLCTTWQLQHLFLHFLQLFHTPTISNNSGHHKAYKRNSLGGIQHQAHSAKAKRLYKTFLKDLPLLFSQCKDWPVPWQNANVKVSRCCFTMDDPQHLSLFSLPRRKANLCIIVVFSILTCYVKTSKWHYLRLSSINYLMLINSPGHLYFTWENQ